jgi:DsbC/DsbD-like thiol-disulfide interchange protein
MPGAVVRTMIGVTVAFTLCACATQRASRLASLEWTELPAIAGWSEAVDAARALPEGPERREAFVSLARTALDGTGRVLAVAGTQSKTEIVPADYVPVPALNFDVDLNRKTSRRFSAATRVRSLKQNAGYYFTEHRVPYVVLGPLSIDRRDPDFLRMYVHHELYHAEHHVGDKRPLADRELEAWTRQFRYWFFRIRRYHQAWGPMVEYYEHASARAQRKALRELTAYYRRPPRELVPPADVAIVQREFASWLKRRFADKRTRSMKLPHALAANLSLETPESDERRAAGSGEASRVSRIQRPAAAMMLCALALACAHGARAQVSLSLVAEDAAARPGHPLTVAVRLDHQPSWHTYWINAGTGFPTTLKWSLPARWRAGEIQWPTPTRILDAKGQITGNGYSGVLLLPVTITPPADAAASGPVTLRVAARWLMCADVCIPGHGDAALTLPVGKAAAVKNAAVVDAIAHQSMPSALPADWKVSARRAGKAVVLTLAARNAAAMTEPHFFSEDGFIQFDLAQRSTARTGGIDLTLPIAADADPKTSRLVGVLAFNDAKGAYRGVSIDAPLMP